MNGKETKTVPGDIMITDGRSVISSFSGLMPGPR